MFLYRLWFNWMQFERDGAVIFISFFASLPLSEFPCEQKILLAKKSYAKACKRHSLTENASE